MSSEELHKRRHAAVARGVTSMVSSYVDHASGGSLHDVDGREWIDFGSGIAVTSVGNAAPRVVAAVRAARRVAHRAREQGAAGWPQGGHGPAVRHLAGAPARLIRPVGCQAGTRP